MGVIGKYKSDDLNYYIGYYKTGIATGFYIDKIVNGTASNLSFTSGTIADNDAHQLTLEINGTSLILYLDGVIKVSTTDSSIGGTGRCGIRRKIGIL